MNEYDLKRLQEDVEHYRSLEKRRDKLQSQWQSLSFREKELAQKRMKEDADVEKWEGGSLAAFFYGVVGKREERLEKEKAEAYEAAMKHDAVKAELAAVEADQKKVEGELKRLEGCEWKYKQAIDEKAAALAAAGKDNGILELEQEQAKIKEQYREIKEALDAGEKALQKVGLVKESLNSAKNWGTWDMMGGDLFSTMMKHERLKEAQRGIEQMQVSLSRFQTELADVAVNVDINVEIGGFSKVADYIFDCLFVDWEIQDQIVSAQNKVSAVEQQIISSCNRLKQMDKELDEKWLRLKQEWQKKIVES